MPTTTTASSTAQKRGRSHQELEDAEDAEATEGRNGTPTRGRAAASLLLLAVDLKQRVD